MARTHFIRRNRNSGSLVAATLVLFTGAGATSLLIAGMGGDPVIALLFLAGSIGLIVTFVYLFSMMPATGATLYGWVRSRYARPEMLEYKPAIRNGGEPASYGTNHPPSAEEVRELRDSANTWVPSGTRGAPSRRRSARSR